MHTFQPFSINEIDDLNPFNKIGKEWALVTAGSKHEANCMTVSWGGLGVMWGKNAAFIFIRDSRYTKKFIDNWWKKFPKNRSSNLSDYASKFESSILDYYFKFNFVGAIMKINGEIVAASEGYTTKANCLNGIESVKKNAPEAEVVKE